MLPQAPPLREPRAGDPIVGAPHGERFAGLLRGVAQGRISVRTNEGETLHFPQSRLTWSARRSAWVLWPTGVLQEIAALERTDTRAVALRRLVHADVGDYIWYARPARPLGGFVVKLLGAPVVARTGVGAVLNSLHGFVLTTPEGALTVLREWVAFDAQARLWIAVPRPASDPVLSEEC